MGYQKAQENARRIDELEKQVAANGVIIQELDCKLEEIRMENERIERESERQEWLIKNINSLLMPTKKRIFEFLALILLAYPNNKKRLSVCLSVRYRFLRNHLTDFDETLHALYTLSKDDVRPKKYRFREKKISKNFSKFFKFSPLYDGIFQGEKRSWRKKIRKKVAKQKYQESTIKIVKKKLRKKIVKFDIKPEVAISKNL